MNSKEGANGGQIQMWMFHQITKNMIFEEKTILQLSCKRSPWRERNCDLTQRNRN